MTLFCAHKLLRYTTEHADPDTSAGCRTCRTRHSTAAAFLLLGVARRPACEYSQAVIKSAWCITSAHIITEALLMMCNQNCRSRDSCGTIAAWLGQTARRPDGPLEELPGCIKICMMHHVPSYHHRSTANDVQTNLQEQAQLRHFFCLAWPDGPLEELARLEKAFPRLAVNPTPKR